MQTSTTTTTRKLACSIGVALAALAAFPAASPAGDSAQSVVRTPELRALTIRGRALNCLYGRAETCMTSAERRALEIRSEGLNRLSDDAATRVSSQELRALRLRGQELNRLYGPAESLMTPAALRALKLRGEAMNRFAQRDPSPSESGSASSQGIDWAAVAIGAGGALGLAFVAATAFLIVRRRQARFA